MYKACI